MKCHICDKELSDKEISFNEDLQAYEPCMYCLEAAFDAAYCDGFNIEDDKYIIIGEVEPQEDAQFSFGFSSNRSWYNE